MITGVSRCTQKMIPTSTVLNIPAKKIRYCKRSIVREAEELSQVLNERVVMEGEFSVKDGVRCDGGVLGWLLNDRRVVV